MPPRTTRSARASTRATARAQAVAASRQSPLNDTPEDTPDNPLRTQVAAVFRDAQRNTATHRKSAVTLRKLQEACCYEPTPADKTVAADYNEDDFNNEFVRCVLRLMPVRKSEAVGERTIRFIGVFMRHAIDKDNTLAGGVDPDASTMPETPSTRLTAKVMSTVLPLMMAKDKFVRFRSTQLISHIVNTLDAMDDELFQKVRYGLLKRIRDKEAMVRTQAVHGLAELAANQLEAEANSDDSDDDEASGLLEKLLEVLQNDPSADVRRSLLVNLPILSNTLPFLLERARDQDAMTRRAVYSRLLPALGDFRHLSLSMREKLLRWGLRDRDDTVRKAAGKLFRERWIEDCAGAPPLNEDGQPAEAPAPSFDGLLELLERIDVVNSGVENGVALEAMRGFWEGRPDYREAVTFDDKFWETLTAEAVFMARSFNDFCRNEGDGKYEDLVEDKLPEVTKLGFYLERYVNVLAAALKRIAQQEVAEGEEEEDTVEQEFIVEQLLHIAMTLDYSDEVGRRKMFSLLRSTLSIPTLPDEVTKLTVNVLRDICAPDKAGEREFCSVVLEAVADVHDTIVDEPNDDESFHSAKSEVDEDEDNGSRNNKMDSIDELTEEEAHAKAVKEILINMKCLHIVQCMLTNVSGSLQENDHLVAMLNNLVVPAVRSHEAPVRERGLLCLGLCSLLDRSLAEENLTLFMHFFTKGHTALQITALHIITDILNVHGAQLLANNPALMRVYVKALRMGSRSPEIQAVATIAASKLLLGRVVTDLDASAEFLKTLVIAYFEPASSQNQSVRQALNYFLPVFCYSRRENQDLLRSVALDALHALYNVREGLEDDDADVDDEMVSLATIGACLVDWTDPRKCYDPDAGIEGEKKHVSGDVHLEFARNILERLDSNCSKEEKKVVAALLGKLYISPASTEDKIREVYADVSDAVETNLIADTTGRNALYKIHVSLGKIVNTLDQAKEAAGRRQSTISRSGSLAPGDDQQSQQQHASAGRSLSARGATVEPGIKEEEEEDDNLDNGDRQTGVRNGARRIQMRNGADHDEEEDDEDDAQSRAEAETVEIESDDDDGGDDEGRASREGTVIHNEPVAKTEPPGDEDSLVSELLDDDGDTVMAG
ncbi:nuclear condensing complex subunit [Coniella lustricola]|uniref:Nuclear condensing complex subunit n=1 Tax=Coniella lustricola TaxID=2025994 RepID=A0A2T3AEN2_9PEZI|nr:nuclear condensing complex subunit [Coniella lustricola]